jgi:lipopolysaccharide export system protein LptA
VLEHVTLRGDGAIAMRGDGEGEAGRQFAGDSLDLIFAADSTLTGVTGRGDVRVELPQGADTPARTVNAQVFEAAGEPGKGLTSGRFSDGVQYAERAAGQQPSRTARAATLQIGLAGDAVTRALFNGGVRFQEGDLAASGREAEYDPQKGTLRVSGADAGASPRVADAQIQIEAASIAITLTGPRMLATGTVKTILQPNRPAAGTQAAADGDGRLPGLLQQGTAVNVNANELDYVGGAGRATYSGNATLWQGETAIRADVLTLDRMRGDLTASGAARSNIVFDTGVSIGRAPEVRYEDARRLITYGPVAPAAPGAIAPTTRGAIAPVSPTAVAQLSGPQGDLRGTRIEVLLAKDESRVERLEAYTGVNVRLDTRSASGDRLTYHAADERYVMTGIATVPVKIVEECRETIGRTVTFFKTADRIIVDGNEEVRTRSSRSGPCAQPAAR